MTTAQKRQALMHVYRSDKWQHKVNKMSDEQVIAIWIRLKNQNKL